MTHSSCLHRGNQEGRDDSSGQTTSCFTSSPQSVCVCVCDWNQAGLRIPPSLRALERVVPGSVPPPATCCGMYQWKGFLLSPHTKSTVQHEAIDLPHLTPDPQQGFLMSSASGCLPLLLWNCEKGIGVGHSLD